MYRNKLNVSLRLAKQNYFSSLLEKEKYNMKNTWKILNSVLRNNKRTVTEKFVKGNKTISDSKEIADEFNTSTSNNNSVIIIYLMYRILPLFNDANGIHVMLL